MAHITEIARTDSEAETKEAVARAVALLEAGGIVAVPTETVYGLAADAMNPEAVARIFEAKDRPLFDPLIVHLPRKYLLHEVADVPEDIAKVVAQLTETFWPGPLTLLLPKKPCIPDIVTAGLPTVAVRVGAHPVFGRIAKAFGRPIAAPSANLFGRISPTSAAAVFQELEGRVPLIIDGGACSRGLESTIIRIEPGEKKPIFHVVRAGPLSDDELKNFGKVRYQKHNDSVENQSPEAPGLLASHYAPRTPLRLIEEPGSFRPEPGKRYGLLSYRGSPEDGFIGRNDWAEVRILSPGSGKMPEAGVRFFFILRELDALGLDEIIAEPVPERAMGRAIMDRLRRASVG
ncbi:MAG: L-threonylcarbamoyladenylate synthase [Verrucomicrobiales bacterium]